MRHERRREIRTERAMAAKGLSPSHQKAGSDTASTAVGQINGRPSAKISTFGKNGLNNEVTEYSSTGKPSATNVAIVAAGQRRTAVRISLLKRGFTPRDTALRRSVISPSRSTPSSNEITNTTTRPAVPKSWYPPPRKT